MNALTFNGPCDTVLSISNDGQVCFQVSNSYTWKRRSKVEQLAITRWLLTTWKKEVLPQREYFYCIPYSGDKIGVQKVLQLKGDSPIVRARTCKTMAGETYRRGIYEKLGFKINSNSLYGKMEYGQPPILPLQCPEECEVLLEGDFPYWEVCTSDPNNGWETAEPISAILSDEDGTEVIHTRPGYEPAWYLPFVNGEVLIRREAQALGVLNLGRAVYFYASLPNEQIRSMEMWGWAEPLRLPYHCENSVLTVVVDYPQDGWAIATPLNEEEEDFDTFLNEESEYDYSIDEE